MKKLIVLLAIIGLVYYCSKNDFGTSAKPVADLGKSTFDQAQAEYGATIVGQLKNQEKFIEEMYCDCGNGPARLSFVISRGAWASLEKNQQIALTHYVESKIQKVRSNPEQYIPIGTKVLANTPLARVYKKCQEDLPKMAWGDWAIVTGDMTSTGDVAPLESVVQGDSAWELRKTGIRASVFRKQ